MLSISTKERKIVMIRVKHNRGNRTHFVYDKYGSVETFISTPYKKSKQATQLTVRSGKNRVDLNGRQVATLRKLLAKAAQLSNK